MRGIRRRFFPIAAVVLSVPAVLFVLGAGASPSQSSPNAAAKVPKPRPRRTTPIATTVSPVTTATTVPQLVGSITVAGATSLTASFTDVAAAFEKANPGLSVRLNFAGSATLVAQIQNGAPVDVFASADTANMDKLAKARQIEAPPVVFARNRLMIVVPKGNPLRVKTLADLARPEVFVALGAVGVPIGDYARQILAAAEVDVRPKTLESNVSAIVNKAALREIDAGIVYVTDVAIDDYRVDGVPIPDEQNIVATYPIAVLSSSGNKPAAAAFVSFTQSRPAQTLMAKYKFLPPK